jgi:hypothetical protein
LQLARVLDQHDAVAGLGDFGQQRVDQRGLAGGRAAGDQHVTPLGHGNAQRFGLRLGHDAGGRIVRQRKHRDRRLPDGKTRRLHHGWDQALEPLAGFWQLGRHARAAGVNLGANMMGDEADDTFAIGGREALAGIGHTLAQPVDPELAVWVEHDLDDGRIFEPAGDVRAERGPQHAGTAREGLIAEWDCPHDLLACLTQPHQRGLGRGRVRSGRAGPPQQG